MHCCNASFCIWHACAEGAGAPSWRCTTSVWRGPITASTARFATLMPTPVAMPDIIDPITPDIMPPPAAGAAAGGGAAGAAAGGGGARVAAGGGAERAGAAGRGLLRRGILVTLLCKSLRVEIV